MTKNTGNNSYLTDDKISTNYFELLRYMLCY